MHYIKVILLLLLTSLHLVIWAQPNLSTGEEEAYLHLQNLASQKLSTHSPNSDEQIIETAYRVEALASRSGNTGREFKASQILVNTYGLSGNATLAVNKAQTLLELALKNTNPIATGLALQAIGDTYMHSERYKEADSIYTQATPYIFVYGDRFMQTQLLFQHLNATLGNKDLANSSALINKITNLLGHSASMPCRDAYSLMLISRKARMASLSNDQPQMLAYIADLESKMPADNNIYQLLVQTLYTRGYMCFGNYEQALIHCDSALLIADNWPKGEFHRSYILLQTQLLEKIGRDDQACHNYRVLDKITDSLYQSYYVSQIDSLHATYWSDHMQISTILHRNSLYTTLILVLLFVVIASMIFGFIIRRQNRKLRQSRLDLKHMRERSADSIRTKSLFLSNMSHELRTPLNAIVGFSSILTEEDQIDEETRLQCSSYIRQNGDLLQKLISDVVDFSQLQDQGIRFSFAPCDVVELCRNVLITINNVKRTEAELNFDCDIDKLVFDVDKNRLQQVLINLLINATKFTKSGNITLMLRLDEQSQEAVFAIEDTGCGIPIDRQPRIFERFEKLHEGVQGAGLGLSICKLIVDYTGGRIWIDSAYTKGARFVFTHPLSYTAKASQQ